MCGIVGAYSFKGENVVPFVSVGSEFLQNRGGMQNQGVGISDGIEVQRSIGRPSQFFSYQMGRLASPIANAGLRYATEGERVGEKNTPPVDVTYRDHIVHLAHNGNIPYEPVLRAWLERQGYQHTRTTDTESLGALLLKEVSDYGIPEGMQRLVGSLGDAACSAVALFPKENTLVSFRDQQGYRPLSMYWDESRGLCLFASEDSAIQNISPEFDGSKIRDVERVEIVVVNKDGVGSYKTTNNRPETFCSFEHIYFGRPDTSLRGLNVAIARFRLGERLWHRYQSDGDFVVVPDSESGDYAAMGYSMASGRPYFKALPKERYPIIFPDGMSSGQRSFMMSNDAERKSVARNRLRLGDFIKGKRVKSIMDSNVRGTTVLANLQNFEDMGVEAADVLVTYGPIRSACHWGIDYRGINELSLKDENTGSIGAANEFMKNWVNERHPGRLKIDSWGYMPPEDLNEVLGGGICMKCLGVDFDGRIHLPEFLVEFYRSKEMSV